MKDDLISRQAAIDALGEEPLVWHEDDAGEVAERNQWRRDVDAIKALPSVDAVPVVHGRWKAVTEGMVTYKRVCSCCGEEAPFDESEDVYLLYPHCPWCGASLDIKGGNGNG